MSGKSKKTLYFVFDGLLFLLACASVILSFFFFRFQDRSPALWDYVAVVAFAFAVLLHLPVLVHEAGHLLFGRIAGMKKAAFHVSSVLRRGDAAGRCEMFPKNGKNVKGKLLCFAFGGTVVNLLVGGALFALYFSFPYHPALVFCVLLAPFMIFEGLRALLPGELAVGKTDGAVILGVLRDKPEEAVMLAALKAQGILYREGFEKIPEALLFSTPVVREDLPAFHALLMLRAQFLLAAGREEEAQDVLLRLSDLSEYLDIEQQFEIKRYLRYFEGKFENKKSLLSGVERLEEEMMNRIRENRTTS